MLIKLVLVCVRALVCCKTFVNMNTAASETILTKPTKNVARIPNKYLLSISTNKVGRHAYPVHSRRKTESGRPLVEIHAAGET
jgi:hypothetical protein